MAGSGGSCVDVDVALCVLDIGGRVMVVVVVVVLRIVNTGTGSGSLMEDEP